MSSGSARKATGGRAGGNDLPRSFVAWGNEGEAKLRYFFNISDGTSVLEDDQGELRNSRRCQGGGRGRCCRAGGGCGTVSGLRDSFNRRGWE
jgi:hypothetical protein